MGNKTPLKEPVRWSIHKPSIGLLYHYWMRKEQINAKYAKINKKILESYSKSGKKRAA